MIVTCPACQTRYIVDDADLRGEAGRRVRCASCGNLWLYSPDMAAIQTAVAEATAEVEAAAQAARPVPASAYAPASPYAPGVAAPPQDRTLRAEPGTQALPRAGPATPLRLAADLALPPSTGPSIVRVGLAALILLVSLLLLFAVFGRNLIMAVTPETVPVYATLGLTEPPSAGLDITCGVTRSSDSVIVAGDIVNRSAVPRRLGQLRITLRDGAGSRLETKLVNPPVGELPPGVTARYEAVFESPSITAVAAEAAFVTQ